MAHDEPLPPGQHVPRSWPVLHYGPVPKFRPERWDLLVHGATASGRERRWTWPEIEAMTKDPVVADFHCVTKFTITGVRWEGILATTIAHLVPPAGDVTHVMVWADYGYSANLRMSDFLAETTLLATHRDGEPLTSEYGAPVRMVVPHLYAWKSVKWVRAIEYLVADRRGFWEERGYHNVADPWLEQRYSYQEEAPPA
jgi:DMSO/TMAO reductase YedYZ molybdopterin-dependent catalytic subunit